MIHSSDIIAALSDDYSFIYSVELGRDMIEIIKLNGKLHDRAQEPESGYRYTEIFKWYVHEAVSPDDRDRFASLMSPDALTAYFADGQARFAFTFKALEGENVHHCSLRCIRISAEYEPLKLIIALRNIDSVVSVNRENRNAGLFSAYAALSEAYMAMHRVDVINNTFTAIRTDEMILSHQIPGSDGYDENMQRVMSALANEACYDDVFAFVDRGTLQRRMACRNHISMEFLGKTSDICKMHFFKEDEDENGRLWHVIFAVEYMDESKSRSVFNALARNFSNVFLINLADGSTKALKMHDQVMRADEQKFYPYQPIIDKYMVDRVHPDDVAMLRRTLSLEHLRDVFAAQDEYIGNYRTLDNGVTDHWQFNIFKLDNLDCIVAGFQNINLIIEAHLQEEQRQRKKEEAYQEMLIRTANDAKRANAAKTEFLLRMSHDIRTPLNGIIGILDVADHFPNDPQKLAECREKARNSSKVLLELVNEVLDMSKLESGEIILEDIPFDLAKIPEDIYISVEKQAAERGIEIIRQGWYLPHTRLIGSPAHYKRMLMNIVGNAVKYNREHGKIYVSCRETACTDDVATIEFTCRDTGIGMSAEFKKHIFDPFSQEHASAGARYSGTGLGMSIAGKICEKMGGTIAIDSTPGVGSTFVVTVPFRIDTECRENARHDDEAAQPSLEGLNILLAEDNDLNMEIAKFLLEDAGAHVLQAVNGREAIDMIELAAPGDIDAIVMDVMMPVMDGYEATRAIRAMSRADAKRIPIIAMTANAFTEDKIAAKEAGMNGHIAKPLDAKTLITTVAKLARKQG